MTMKLIALTAIVTTVVLAMLLAIVMFVYDLIIISRARYRLEIDKARLEARNQLIKKIDKAKALVRKWQKVVEGSPFEAAARDDFKEARELLK